mgnify:CR=1 FL=1
MTAGFVPDSPRPSPSPSGFTPDNRAFAPDKPTSGFAPDQPKPKTQATPSGLDSVNPGVNVVGDYLTRWTKFAGGAPTVFRTVSSTVLFFSMAWSVAG